MSNLTDYVVEQAVKVLSIDSPTGFTARAAEYVMGEYRKLGYDPVLTNKSGILVCVNEGNGQPAGKPEEGPILLQAHMDTLGGMVCSINEKGRLALSPLGGMNPNNGEAENCRVYTRTGKVYTGTFQMKNASIHVNGDYNTTARSYDVMEVVLDELVESKADTLALGILPGDIVAFDPRTVVTESGFIKSRFLDDKLSVGILLGYARHLKESETKPARKIYQHITVFEEVGHGGSGSVLAVFAEGGHAGAGSGPADATEILAVDMGCVGDGLDCKETQVSICAKDSGGPYHYDVVSGLVSAAQKANLDFAVDVYPHYGSDAEAALRAGYDCRHGLIGSGVYASHGYERSHKKGVENTLGLLISYLG